MGKLKEKTKENKRYEKLPPENNLKNVYSQMNRHQRHTKRTTETLELHFPMKRKKKEKKTPRPHLLTTKRDLSTSLRLCKMINHSNR